MSYCRFSSDDYQCDVYVWADVDGTWRTEVASRRHVFHDDPTLPPPMPSLSRDAARADHVVFATALVARHATITAILRDETKWSWLDLPAPDGGTSYSHDTPGECADNLLRLRAAGFNVPQAAIDLLREEQQDQDASAACDPDA